MSISPNKDYSMTLNVVTDEGPIIKVKVKPEMNLESIKSYIGLIEGYPVPNQRLFYKNEHMRNDSLIKDFDLQDGSTIHLMNWICTSPVKDNIID